MPTSGAFALPPAGVHVQGNSFVVRTRSAQSSLSSNRTAKSSPNFAVPLSPSIIETKEEEAGDLGLADELDYISITAPSSVGVRHHLARSDKASRVLGVQHRRSMEPIPAAVRTSIVSTRSAREVPSIQSFTPTLPLTSLYVVSGLPKAPHTWTLADPDSVLGLTHSEGAVNRWWRAEVLGSTVSPGAGGGKKKKKVKGETEVLKGAGALSKQDVGKMLSKALKVRTIPCHTPLVNSFQHFFLVVFYSRSRDHSFHPSTGVNCSYLFLHTSRAYHTSSAFFLHGSLTFLRFIFVTLRSAHLKCYITLSVPGWLLPRPPIHFLPRPSQSLPSRVRFFHTCRSTRGGRCRWLI